MRRADIRALGPPQDEPRLALDAEIDASPHMQAMNVIATLIATALRDWSCW